VRKLRVCSSLLLSAGRLASIGTLLVLFASCGQGVRTTPAMPLMQGVVQGGQQPVSGANIALYAVGSSGYGMAANTSILTSTVTSGTDGSFSITGQYMCTPGSLQMYLVATGGDSGSGTNSSLALMAALGSCSGLSSSTHVVINEVTTVAAVYALAPFMATNSANPGATVDSSSGNSQGLMQAFATANNLVDTSKGAASGASLPSGATVPVAELNTLADIIAPCVNSDGSSGECSTLFADATPSGGGSAPQNTIDALLDVAQNPSNNASQLNSLVTGTSPFQPILGSAPNDWTVAINYTDSSLNAPTALAVNSAGAIWVVNNGGNSITIFSNSGSVLSGSGYTRGGLSGPRFLAIDSSADVWITNANNSVSEFNSSGSPISTSTGFTGSGLSSPQMIAILTGNNIIIADSAASAVSKLNASNGTPYAGSPFTHGGVTDDFGLAVDPSNNVWLANGNNTLSEIGGASGNAIGSTPFSGGGLNSPLGIAIDRSHNLWIANNGGASLSEFNSGGTPVSVSGFTGGGLVDPTYVAVDGSNNIWVSNPTANRLSEFNSSGTAISGSTGYTSGGLSGPGGFAIDGSGNLWVPNSSSNTITEFVGVAGPVFTPLITAVKSTQLGNRP
jgi:hypothetical protein